MQIKKLLVVTLFGGQAMLSAAVLAEDPVKNYVDSSGGPVTNASGECWRTPYADTGERREECGDREEQVVEVEVVAAPTAGLHFNEDMLARIAQRGIRRATVTLHVGAGTF